MLIASEAVIPAEIFQEADPTCQFITRVTEEADWKELIQESTERIPTFRATFRKGSIKHKVPSQEIAGYVGAAFGTVYSHWKVKMTGFDYEIMSVWFQSSDPQLLSRLSAEDSNNVILLVGLNIPIQDQKHRNRVFFGPTSLNPCIAYCLAMIADPKPGQIVFDMCCGTGTIPIEVLRYDWCKKQWSTDKVIPIGIGGYEVYLYILSKKSDE
ncbi:THUMP domain-containing protein 3 [Rhizopus stolonifer]|uniref:THUMP domain-containing protein 3 n=1 Tax=Rhizopus stolonifer TaxID=4846 RepID=A0A367KU47_RHIST|nr:THUMP domain-containing protein 3 [Rhizopus stolonifer]